MLPDADTYEVLVERFAWAVPRHYNIGVDVCDRWAAREPDRPALIVAGDGGSGRTVSYGDLCALSNRIAHLLARSGVARGDRVAVLLPQAVETAATHIASFKLGAISIPLFMPFGPDALRFRLGDSGAKVVVTNAAGAAKLAGLRADLPDLAVVFAVDGPAPGARDLHGEMAGLPNVFDPAETEADDPALIIYTSGTTGPPRGALHAHRVLPGHLPGVEISHDLLPQPGDLIWTPADWAWIGGLLDVLLPALHHGVPVVVQRFAKFDPEAAFGLIADLGVRNAFIPPTALKLMRTVDAPERRWSFDMRTIASGGETLGAELLDWGRRVFGLTINEFYGQTECNMIVSSCARVMQARPGHMGRAVPGHEVAVIDDAGRPVPDGTQGTIAVRRPDPVMFLEYWRNPDATAAKFAGDWLKTGDTGVRDADGWLTFVGRDDDIITSAGYRIGPGEIEDCLIAHPAVSMAGVVGVPDPVRTQAVKAFVVLAEGHVASDDLAAELQDFVKQRLAAHEYPRQIAFVDALPLTATGKIVRRDLRGLG